MNLPSSKVKVKKKKKTGIIRAVTSQFSIVFSKNFVKMFTIIRRRVEYKIHESMSKVKVTLRGQRSIFCNLYLVWVMSSQVIVVYS